MAKQEFLELAQELSGRNLFDVDSVASFLEANFKAINLDNELVETDEKRQRLILDKEKHMYEISALKRVSDRFRSNNDIGGYYQSLQKKIKHHQLQVKKIDSQLQVLKSKRKAINIEKAMEADRMMLEALKSHLKKEMGENYTDFISGLRVEIENNLKK